MYTTGWLVFLEYHSVVLGSYEDAIKDVLQYLKEFEQEHEPNEYWVRFYRDKSGMSEHQLNKHTANFPDRWDDLYKVVLSDACDDAEIINIEEVEIRM